MNWQKRFGVELIAVLVMIAVVSVLAVYQYRWTGEISRTEQARLRNSLATSVRNFDQEFSYDFQQLCESFELDPEAEPLRGRIPRGAPAGELDQNECPRGICSRTCISGRRAPPMRRHWNPSVKLTIVSKMQTWPPDLESLHRYLTERGEFVSSPIDDREAVYYPWTFFGDAPALIRPIFQIAPGGHDSSSGVHTVGVLIVVLNREYLEQEYLPNLVDRYFGASGQRSFVVSVRTVQGALPNDLSFGCKFPHRNFFHRRGRQSVRSGRRGSAKARAPSLAGERRGRAMATGRSASRRISGGSGCVVEAPQSRHQSGLARNSGGKHGAHFFRGAPLEGACQDADGIRRRSVP